MSANIYFSRRVSNAPACAVDVEVPFNMANGNAAHFLTCLGYDANFWNAEPYSLPEFAGAVARFLGSEAGQFVDRGTETRTETGEGGATMIYCGRREDYVTERCKALVPCMALAMEKGATHLELC